MCTVGGRQFISVVATPTQVINQKWNCVSIYKRCTYYWTVTYSYFDSSSCRAASMDIPDPLLPLFPIIHRLWQVFWATPPLSSHSCCMYVLVGRPALAHPYVGVHRSTSLMSSSLLLQQCPACLARLTWIVFVMGGRWPYSWCLWGVAARTCLILLATFLCSCRLASSPAVLLVSKWCIHTAVLTRPLLGRNCVSFISFNAAEFDKKEKWLIILLPLLLGLLWSGGVVPVRVSSIGQIEIFNHLLY